MFGTNYGTNKYLRLTQQQDRVANYQRQQQKSQRISQATRGKTKSRKPEQKGKHRKKVEITKTKKTDTRAQAEKGVDVDIKFIQQRNRRGQGRPPRGAGGLGRGPKEAFEFEAERKKALDRDRQNRPEQLAGLIAGAIGAEIPAIVPPAPAVPPAPPVPPVAQRDLRQQQAQERAERAERRLAEQQRAEEIRIRDEREQARERAQQEDIRAIAEQQARGVAEINARIDGLDREVRAGQQIAPPPAVNVNVNPTFENIGNPTINVDTQQQAGRRNRRVDRNRRGGGGGARHRGSGAGETSDSSGGDSPPPQPSPRTTRQRTATARERQRTRRVASAPSDLPSVPEQPQTAEEEATILQRVAGGVAEGVATGVGALGTAVAGGVATGVGALGTAVAEQLPTGERVAEGLGEVAGAVGTAVGQAGQAGVSLLTQALADAPPEAEPEPPAEAEPEPPAEAIEEYVVVKTAPQPSPEPAPQPRPKAIDTPEGAFGETKPKPQPVLKLGQRKVERPKTPKTKSPEPPGQQEALLGDIEAQKKKPKGEYETIVQRALGETSGSSGGEEVGLITLEEQQRTPKATPRIPTEAEREADPFEFLEGFVKTKGDIVASPDDPSPTSPTEEFVDLSERVKAEIKKEIKKYHDANDKKLPPKREVSLDQSVMDRSRNRFFNDYIDKLIRRKELTKTPQPASPDVFEPPADVESEHSGPDIPAERLGRGGGRGAYQYSSPEEEEKSSSVSTRYSTTPSPETKQRLKKTLPVKVPSPSGSLSPREKALAGWGSGGPPTDVELAVAEEYDTPSPLTSLSTDEDERARRRQRARPQKKTKFEEELFKDNQRRIARLEKGKAQAEEDLLKIQQTKGKQGQRRVTQDLSKINQDIRTLEDQQQELLQSKERLRGGGAGAGVGSPRRIKHIDPLTMEIAPYQKRKHGGGRKGGGRPVKRGGAEITMTREKIQTNLQTLNQSNRPTISVNQITKKNREKYQQSLLGLLSIDEVSDAMVIYDEIVELKQRERQQRKDE